MIAQKCRERVPEQRLVEARVYEALRTPASEPTRPGDGRNSRTPLRAGCRQDMSEASVGAQPDLGERPAVQGFKAGRVCQQAGCETMLSIYNDGKFCYQHEPMSYPGSAAARSPDPRRRASRPAWAGGVPSLRGRLAG